MLWQVVPYKIRIPIKLFDLWLEGKEKLVCITVKVQMYLIDIQNHAKVSQYLD